MGNAKGSCTVKSFWKRVAPDISAASTISGGTPRNPSIVYLVSGTAAKISIENTTATSFNVSNATSTLVNTTGYYRVFGNIQLLNGAATQYNAEFLINDGTTTKSIFKVISVTSSGLNNTSTPFNFLVKLQAGDSLQAVSSGTFANLTGCTRQIADLSGNLTNP